MPRNTPVSEVQAAYDELLNATPTDEAQVAMQEDVALENENAQDAPVPPALLSVRNGAGRVASTADGRLKANAPTVPENADRVKLTGTIRGVANPKYNGSQASVISRSTHTWDRHAGDWVQVLIDGQNQCRWFYAEEVKAVRAPRRLAPVA